MCQFQLLKFPDDLNDLKPKAGLILKKTNKNPDKITILCKTLGENANPLLRPKDAAEQDVKIR